MRFEEYKAKLIGYGWNEEEANLWALWETNADTYDSVDYYS